MDHEKWHWQESGTSWKGVGIYHVTLVVPSRKPLLGRLVIPDNDPTKAIINRTELGNALVEKLLDHPSYYPEIRILQFCLMPNHLHAILYVTRPMTTSIRSVVRSLWQGAKKLGREYSFSIDSESHSEKKGPEYDSGSMQKREMPEYDSGSIQKREMPEYDSGSMQIREMPIDPIFTEQPFIRPLSRYSQLQTMYDYIRMNPQRLATMILKPGYFRVQSGIEIGGRVYAGVGNAELLQARRYCPVHVRRVMVEAAEHGDSKALDEYMSGCEKAAREGTVMVSPFISPKEKEIMDVLLREKLPFVYIADNGFKDYYKPMDALFEAVAEGRVLILSPWEYEENKKHVTREECVAMNMMAEEICGEMNGGPLQLPH